MKTRKLLPLLATALAATLAAAPAYAGAATQGATSGTAAETTAPDLSLTIDWRAASPANDDPGLVGPADLVDFAHADPALSTWYAGVRGYDHRVGVYAIRNAQYPWNAPTSFDVPYLVSVANPDGSSSDQTGTLHVTVTNLPTPPVHVEEPDVTSNFDMGSLWDSGRLVFNDGDPTQTWINLRPTDSPSAKTLLPLNATMARYFKLEHEGSFLTMSRRAAAPKLPTSYWTKSWFAVDYTAHVTQCDPTRACSYGEDTIEDQPGQVRFTSPPATLRIYPGPFRTSRPNDYQSFLAVNMVKKARGLQLGTAQLVVDSVDQRTRRTYRIVVERHPFGDGDIDFELGFMPKAGGDGPDFKSTVRYHLTGLDRAGHVVASNQAVLVTHEG